jgi:hypothetical protein
MGCIGLENGLNSILQAILSTLSPAVVVGIAAIVVAIILFTVQRRKKALSYEIVSETSLLRTHEELEGRLQILFDSKPIRDAYLMLIKLANAGNLPIMPADFERPLSIDLGEKANVLTVDVLKKDPENLAPRTKIDNHVIVIEPLLLNGGDSFTLKTIVSQYSSGKIEINGRIAGVRGIRGASESRWPFAFMSIGVLLFILGLGITFANIEPVTIKPVKPADYLALAIAGFGEGLMFLGMFRKGKLRQFRQRMQRVFSE